MKWYRHYSEVPKSEWPWVNFTSEEMADSKTGEVLVDPAFMNWLQGVRTDYGHPVIVTSGHRTPAHQQTLPGSRITGSHVDAQAVDIKVYGFRARTLIGVACAHSVMGIGVHQTGDINSRYLHLDMWTKAPPSVRPYIWSY
ncbi:MAG: D-Ala-D-Ala carboxypeptidase family metallohydrolase [Geminicoccaceae bacterium]